MLMFSLSPILPFNFNRLWEYWCCCATPVHYMYLICLWIQVLSICTSPHQLFKRWNVLWESIASGEWENKFTWSMNFYQLPNWKNLRILSFIAYFQQESLLERFCCFQLGLTVLTYKLSSIYYTMMQSFYLILSMSELKSIIQDAQLIYALDQNQKRLWISLFFSEILQGKTCVWLCFPWIIG